MVLNVVGSNPIGHPRKSLATFRCEGFFVWYWLYYARPSIAMKQRRRSYSFNTAEKLNTLLLRMIRRMGLIKVGSHVDLDLITSLFQPTSSMQSILTSRILAISQVGLPLGES